MIRGTVCGIAQLGDEIFITSESSTSIFVFSFQGRENFRRCDDVGFRELASPPQDIAASEAFQKLFVADSGGRSVWQLGKSSWGYWRMENRVVSKVEPVSLSMNAGRLLVVEKRRLNVFGVGASRPKVKSTSLPEDMEAVHALETSCDTFVVCGKVAGKPGIAEVNKRGLVVRGCDLEGFSQPCYLSPFDTVEADVLVADCATQQVVLLNSSLMEVVRVFLDKDHDRIFRPRRVVKSGFVLVGHCKSADDSHGTVSLYWPRMTILEPLPD